MLFEKINGVDEVIVGDPKYVITNNSDGTVNISLANEITQQATNVNKAFTDIIDDNFNVCENETSLINGYSTPNYVVNGTTYEYYLNNFNNSFLESNKIVLVNSPIDNSSGSRNFTLNGYRVLGLQELGEYEFIYSSNYNRFDAYRKSATLKNYIDNSINAVSNRLTNFSNNSITRYAMGTATGSTYGSSSYNIGFTPDAVFLASSTYNRDTWMGSGMLIGNYSGFTLGFYEGVISDSHSGYAGSGGISTNGFHLGGGWASSSRYTWGHSYLAVKFGN